MDHSAAIAIIGLGLRLPGADTLDGFWRHLAAGRSLIREVPRNRWDKERWQGDPSRDNKTNCIWGGFLDDADGFDADFFGISPREAAWMDPQQRFALEMAWHAIEDAGYAPAALAGSRTGVFMGVCHWDYAELLEKHLAQVDAYTPTGIAFSIIANRVSHFFDFRGPSVTNDTACAASATALHDAVRAIQAGECDQALAGGVNLIWSPNHFVAFAKAGMLSKDGRAKAFDAAADGYVRGEGGAVVLLKPLARALADGDAIHGVIRGIGVNHGGRTNSLTVTNPAAQAALITEVITAAGIAPDTVSYIEAHGPGTPLGDPIEIAGLKQAFARLYERTGVPPVAASCGIGSVKTNIGHLEGAAGVAGLVKVLASLRHDLLPANVGFERINPLIDLTGTPFRIQAEATPWPRRTGQPRRAGVSSFGFGGSNAHILVEDAPSRPAPPAVTGPAVLPLSARDETRLAALIEDIKAFAAALPAGTGLDQLAYTLQVGRDTMACRAAVTAPDWTGLAAALAANRLLRPGTTEMGPAAAWVNGGNVDWAALWPTPPGRIHAPLSRFSRQIHWMDPTLAAKNDAPVPHPLLHRNLSGFAGIRHDAILTGREFVWADHHVAGTQVLPGVVALEMARAAATLSQATPLPMALENVVWARPIRAGDDPITVETRLERHGDGFAFFVGQPGHAGPAHCQGLLHSQDGAQATMDLTPPGPERPIAACYERLRASGVVHGPTYQSLAKLFSDGTSVLAQIKLPRRLRATLATLPLHPVLLDGAIQAWVGLDGMDLPGAAVPFACQRIEILGPCEPVMWARLSAIPNATANLVRLNIELADKEGQVRVRLHDLALRVMAAPGLTDTGPHQGTVLLAASDWRMAPLPADRVPAALAPVIVTNLDAAPFEDAIHLPAPGADMAAAAWSWFQPLHAVLRDAMAGSTQRRVLVLAGDNAPPPLLDMVAALLKTACQEQPRLDAVLIRVAGPVSAARLTALVTAESDRGDRWPDVRYDADDTRYARVPREITLADDIPRLDPAGTYWITGGLGALGRRFAVWLLERGARQVVLSGRGLVASDDTRLAALGPRVSYVACDVADPVAVRTAVAGMTRLKGIIHAAGSLDDGYLLTRDATRERAVLTPKVDGVQTLDRETSDIALDFLLLCSSVAATFGNPGQSGYGAANGFLDGFATWRTAQVAAGRRHGTTLAVAWPLWAEGGMGTDAATQAALKRRFGTIPMPTDVGLSVLDRIVAAGTPSMVTVLFGAPDQLRRTLTEFGQGPHKPAAHAPVPASGALDPAQVRDFVRDILAEVLHLDPSQIRSTRKLDEYGLDSIAIVEATNRLEDVLGPLSKTLFFEYVDLAGIAAHLTAEHGPALVRALGPAEAAPAAAQPTRIANPVKRHGDDDSNGGGSERESHDVAIVGLSLQVSKASDQKAFWDMLAGGLDGFEPYPANRWNHQALLHPERDVLGKTVVKTGAFLEDIAAFDPRYFHISQYEAELMSPEVRLFLQASVEAFEDAGYSRETLLSRYGGDVAVVMGSMTNEYDLYGFQNMLLRGSLASGSYTGTIPNMVSYFYGFTGPSYFLDTMCSASSTCVHEAVHMLRSGRCRMALAGGVSLLLHPQKLIATSQEHFTSKTAEVIRGYGLGADGTILGEGVGALVLKRLGDARRDGDHIYGVIRGTAVSNAGIRNGFTVPNPRQQAAAIEAALADADISAATITYVEGHGSGTALGDPIEIRALTQAWRKDTDAVQTCPIGTVKSNVAHLLAASGVAGIVKVLMQMRHGQLAPSLHAEELNPNIAFAQTPFYVQRTLSPWHRLTDAAGHQIPRRAGVTSIGAGGMNSHIVIEEFIAPPASTPGPTGPQVLPLSAMSEAALVTVARRLLEHLDAQPDQPLPHIAYTLQVGRNQLPCRLALLASDHAHAANQLRAFISRPGPAAGYWYSRSVLDREPSPPSDAHSAAALAAAWASGWAVDWDTLHHGHQPRRVSLPAYPFERVRCWYPEQPDAPSVVNPLAARLKLHPLVGCNVSTLAGLAYSTDLYLPDLLDYVCKQAGAPRLLPTAALEMGAALARLAGLTGPLTLSDITIEDPQWNQRQHMDATIDPAGNIRVTVDGRPWLTARAAAGAALPPVSVPEAGEQVSADQFYAQLEQLGLDFTPYLHGVQSVTRFPDGAVACLLRSDPPQQDHYKRQVQLPAAALGAAFQSLASLGITGMGRVARLSLAGTGVISRVLAQPQPDGHFGLWFLSADGTPLAQASGIEAHTDSKPHLGQTLPSTPSQPGLAEDLRRIAADLLKFPPDQIGLRDGFHDLGFDSISLTRLAAAVSSAYAITLSPAIFFEAEHLEALAAHLASRHGITPAPAREPSALVPPQPARLPPAPALRAASSRDGIAIIGMAGRFPGADDIESLFGHLIAGDDLTGPARQGPWRGGFLSDVAGFDAALFRISPAEAERMDPQQRLMLETAWRALENAGYRPEALPSDTAVLVGASALDYAALLRRAGLPADGYDATGNSLAMIANRVSHFFNLRGPSETIDTACSSSLVALLRAGEALRQGICRTALVGGVNLALAPEGFEGPAQAGMLSPDGRCKSFGATADGYGRGEGVVMVMLKRLADAERDGDRILGVMIGGAENHGGHAGALTAPNVKAQAELIRTAMAGIDPRSLSYIETHGTGTALGDPVEVNGLRRAFEAMMGDGRIDPPGIALGTVKSNIGHLEAAAGLAGLVKVLQAMAHGILPASLHCTPPNPHLDLDGSPFRLLAKSEPWPAGERPRRAGISSFGFGGSNAHVVVEDYPTPPWAQRQPLPPRQFVHSRFWFSEALATDKASTMVLTPVWTDAPPALAGRSVSRRIVLAAAVTVTGAHPLPTAYEAAATALMDVLAQHSGDALVQLAVPLNDPLAGLGGMLASAALERPGLITQLVELEAMPAGDAADLLQRDARDTAIHIRHAGNRRLVAGWQPLTATAEASWRPRGVTLITGGTGGLGRLLARDIARSAPGSVLVLAGSTPEDDGKAAFIAELRELGAIAAYRQVDMADQSAVVALVRGIVEVHGALHQVLHCAGTLRDGLLRGKSATDLAAVLAPKVAGSRALLTACAGLPLDALVLFSSLAAPFGNLGQGDYAAANGFMDALAQTHGLPLVTVNWPLWAEGGMTASDTVRHALFERMGQRPLATAEGIRALRRILAAKVTRAAVVAGDGDRIQTFFGLDRAIISAPTTPLGGSGDSGLTARLAARLADLFAQAGGFARDAIAPHTPLEEYGIDSLMISRLNAALGDGLGTVPKTLFFQYRTLGEMAAHLVRDHAQACRRWLGETDILAASSVSVPTAPSAPCPVTTADPASPIAIIGIAGRYPGATDLAGFWANLAAGRDAVTEIPPDRWELDDFFTADMDEAVASGRSYAKWGAFLDGFADFDPLFFRISPRDAAAMDPQERLFLMCAWAAVENAGYSPDRLAAANPVAVFAGITKTGYAHHAPFPGEGGAMVHPSTSFASVANRVSHALNLTGPSLPVDTMCSSSATALHEACEHLRSGAATMALAGGVNLYLHPNTFTGLSAARMLSPDGRCKSFGKGANGFVPGEGVGCVVLKPLSRALADGDHIHAVIRASAINHGGHTNGYTVPNPAAQRDLVRAALTRAGLDAGQISYVEAHGTGTDLGDPIEVEGLTQAFRADTQACGFCALGSVKSNIGHLEAAAGIAGLTKIVLSMQHGSLPPSLHAEETNPNLNLPATPFVLQRRLAPWQPAGRRIAALSSFGAGGANAHLIIEEAPSPSTSTRPVPAAPQAIVLSARDEAGLRRRAEQLLGVLEQPASQEQPTLAIRDELARLLAVNAADIDTAESFDEMGLSAAQRLALRGWIENRWGHAIDPVDFCHLDSVDAVTAALAPDQTPPLALADIAYTLQVGREAMEHRLALVSGSCADLAEALRRWLAGDGTAVRTGRRAPQRDGLAALGDEAAVTDMVAAWVQQGQWDKVLSLWVNGLDLDWGALPRPFRPAIVPLPTYPFACRQYWIPTGHSVGNIIRRHHGDGVLLDQARRLDQIIAAILATTLRSHPETIPPLARWRQAAEALLADAPAVADDPWRIWSEWRDQGGPAAQMALAETTLRALPDILAGHRPATAVIFPAGSLSLVEATYKDNPVAARFSRTLAEAAAAFVRTSSRPAVRILEIGAGTGGTTEPVLDALAPLASRIAEYRYTDLSRAFLIHAERAYGPRWPQLHPALFDVEKPPAGQDVTVAGYDLVIAANVLHATADMARTMAHVRELLAPGGMVLINETSQASLFTHVTFGLLEGWWRFTDPERRIPGTPSLTPETWCEVLDGAGLRVEASSDGSECTLGQQIIAARAPGHPEAVQPISAHLPASTPGGQPPHPVITPRGQNQPLRTRLLAILGETLNVSPESIDPDRSFADYGLDSILGADLVHRLRRGLGIELDQTVLFDHTTVTRLETFLSSRLPAPLEIPALSGPVPAQPVARHQDGSSPQPIAIIGYSGRFAHSPDAEALWAHLLAGDDLVEPVSRFDLTSLYRDAPSGSFGRHGSFLDGIAEFDPVFFGISGLEATYMDPQQRLFLEEAWKTLDHAGHAGDAIDGRKVGVFVGASAGDYDDLFAGRTVPGQAFWGNTSSLIPARIAYFLDFKGPAIAVDTACSSSLVALHLACRSLWNHECEMAMAGGVFVQCTPRFYLSANQANMLSPSGRCAAFGAGADGIVPGEAVGAVLLRPLNEALAEGDTIHGVIVASGINQDGTTNGITAPSAASQERLIRDTYAQFGIDPASIGLIEAHGTGTPLGDPIEFNALARVFASNPAGSVALGSVKSNIGHATTAAGIAGLIKALLCLKHHVIAPTLHYHGGNPAIRHDGSALTVHTQPLAWTRNLRAGISSFGFSGTNAHVVVEAPPPATGRPAIHGPHLFVLSGRTADLLRAQAADLAAHLENHDDLAAADVAFTLAAGRRHLRHRLAVTAADLSQLAERLRQWLADGTAPGTQTGEAGDSEVPVIGQPVADNDPDAILASEAAAFVTGSRPRPPLQGRRIPLPVTRFARSRFWIDPAPTPIVAAPSHNVPPPWAPRPAFPLRLADPATLSTSMAATPASPRIALAPLCAPIESSREQNDGVLRLRLAGDGAGLAADLRRAGADPSIRVILVEGERWRGDATALLECPLPVVAATSNPALADAADFSAADPARAGALAAQVAAAPRLSLVELKHAMRGTEVPEAVSPWPGSEAPFAGGSHAIALATSCVTLEAMDDGVMVVRMQEREHKNCFTNAFMDGLSEAFSVLAGRSDAKVVVLTGFDGYFACGGTREGLEQLQQGATRFTDRTIYSLPLECPLPVIAAMQGHAIGAGWSLGMFCDIQIFATEGVYHSNYLWYGFTPGAGATLVFPHRLGERLGREILFTAQEFRGRELAARHPGITAVTGGQVLGQALARAHGLATLPRDRLLALKELAAQPLRQRLAATFDRELAMHAKTFVGNPRVQERIASMFPDAAPATPAAPSGGSAHGAVRTKLAASLAEDLMIDASDIHDDDGFLDLGLDSILAVTWIRRVNALFGTDLPATAVYAHPTFGALATHVAGLGAHLPASPPPPLPPSQPLPADTAASERRNHVRQQVVTTLAEDLMIANADIHDDSGFLELGLDSILAVTWVRRLGALLDLDLPATIVYAHPTVGALIAHLAARVLPAKATAAAPARQPARLAAPEPPAPEHEAYPGAIAIIGMSGRFPKAADLDAFWQNLRTGRDCVSEVPPDRWDVTRFFHPDPLHAGTSNCKWMGAIDDVDRFDAGFFNITPREAELMDPQQRLFLQHAWLAIEDAGRDPTTLAGTACGIFVGAGPSGYADLIADHNAYSLLGRSGSILAARLAHLLDLRGPCISLDTACSSSLVAIAEACNSLRLGDSDLALAGGVSVLIGPEMFIDTTKVNMLSKDGRCFTFDQRANGFVPGEGAGVLLLKRLTDAIRDKDPIHAVVRGWGINQDGRTNGITAPNPQAQTRLMRTVQQKFGIDAASIQMVECHGTGTPLGDPIEIEGLTGAFAGSAAAPGSVALGSVKSNVGHLLAAAGVAGALKAALAVERGEVPPTINFESLNGHIALDGSPFTIATTLRPWPVTHGPRRAAVSAFGFSGTNAHVVIEQAPEAPVGPRTSGPWVLPLSGRDRSQLAANAAALRDCIAAHPELDTGDIAYTLQVGRKPLRWRAAFAFGDRSGLLKGLESLAADQPLDIIALSDAPPSPEPPLEASRLTATALAQAWAGGRTILWAGLWAGIGRRCHLPGTQFARDRHWVTPAPVEPAPAAPASHRPLAAWSLPELARLAGERDGGSPVRSLRHLVWGRPAPHGARLETVVDHDEMGRLFRIVADGSRWEALAVGEIAHMPPPAPPAGAAELGSDALAGDALAGDALAGDALAGDALAGDALIEAFRRFAPEIVPGLTAVWRRGTDVFASGAGHPGDEIFSAHILDLGWRLAAFASGTELQHPHAAESLTAYGPLPAEFIIRVATRPGIAHPDITMLDRQGQTHLHLVGLRTAPFTALTDIFLGEDTES